MRLIGTETKSEFRRRLEGEGCWQAFVTARESLKGQGVEGWDAWQQAGQAFLKPLSESTDRRDEGNRAEPLVGLWLVAGPVDARRTQAILAAATVPVIAVADHEAFRPMAVGGCEAVGVLPARPEDQADAHRLVEQLRQAMPEGGAVRLFGDS